MTDLKIESCLKQIEDTFELEAEHIVRGQIAEIGALARTKAEQLEDLYKVIEAGGLRGQSDAMIKRVQKTTNDGHRA